MISIDAVVTKISGVRPRMYSATFKWCGMRTSHHHSTTKRTGIDQPNGVFTIDGVRSNKSTNSISLLQERSTLTNSQFIELQELPEQVRGGVQPERISSSQSMTLPEKSIQGTV